MKRLLFIQLASNAELIVMTACFHSIKKSFPDCEIDLLCTEKLVDILNYIPGLNIIYFIDTLPLKELLNLINSQHYDAFIDVQRKLFDESKTVAKKIKSLVKIGYNLPGKNKPFDLILDKSKKPLLSDHYLKCLTHLGIQTASQNYHLKLDFKKVESERPNLVIYLVKGVSNLETMSKLLTTQLAQILDFQFICSEKDAEWAQQIESIEYFSNHNELIELISQSTYLISGQSYAVQLADYFKSPVVYLSDGTDYNRLLCSNQTESVILTSRSKKDSTEQISLDALIQGIRSVCGFI